ncbi:MAG: hypothetical protein U1E64_12655 [Sphingomonadaceae bacterium]
MGESIVLQTGKPLAGIYGTFPARFVFSMILARSRAERNLGRGFVLFLGYNVASINLDRFAIAAGLLAGLSASANNWHCPDQYPAASRRAGRKSQYAPPRLSTLRISPSPS